MIHLKKNQAFELAVAMIDAANPKSFKTGATVTVSGRYNDGGGWTCMDFKTGDVKWQERGPGKGAICAADGMIYCYGEDNGTVVLAEASPAGWKQTGEFTIPQKTKHPRKSGKIWVHPVIANGKLYLRDNEHLFCYDVKAP